MALVEIFTQKVKLVSKSFPFSSTTRDRTVPSYIRSERDLSRSAKGGDLAEKDSKVSKNGRGDLALLPVSVGLEIHAER
jgi:hypothetical protein